MSTNILSLTEATAIRASFDKERGGVRRAAPTNLTHTISGIQFPVNTKVRKEDGVLPCLDAIPNYRDCQFGDIKEDQWHIALAVAEALENKTNLNAWIYGTSGTGKDAWVHNLASQLRIPSRKFSIAPNKDTEAWMYTHRLKNGEDYYDFGKLWEAATEGYTDADGVVHPYLILVSDMDRANGDQMETFRTLMDTNAAQVDGPGGISKAIIPGTIIIATANSMGGGDETGRCLSSNVVDASIINRFHMKIKFTPMQWEDEQHVCLGMFPHLFEAHPSALQMVGQVTTALRTAISKSEVYTEFSARDLQYWLAHCCRIMKHSKSMKTQNLLKLGFRTILDGQPDSGTRLAVARLANPTLGTI